MKEQNGNDKKKPWWKGEKKFYLITAIGCAAVLLAVIVVAVAVSGNQTQTGGKHSSSSSVTAPDSSSAPDNSSGKEDDKPVDGGAEGMLMPIESVTVSNDYGFWYNQTLNCYYEHKGMDFTAAAGTEVLAAQAGVVESIYKDDLLLGTEITVNHGNGLKTVYRFVEETEGLKIGDSVERGQVIGVVAEANGEEYKEGAHLHFEILQNGANVDPATHLNLEEK